MTVFGALSALLDEDLPPAAQVTYLRQLALERLDSAVLVAAVEAFRARMVPVDLGGDAVDLCGTGGDGAGSFNISTTASFVAAAAGVPVAKHGNVSITSRSGGVDLLRALGVRVPVDADEARRQFDVHGIVFLFAQHFHPAFKKFTEARRLLAAEGIRTIFNLLGPLLNPARVTRSIMGVFAPELVEFVAQAKLETGTQRALVMHGAGMDELTLVGENVMGEIRGGEIFYSKMTPEDFGFARCSVADIAGGGPEENAKITLGILEGSITGARRDIVLLNAAAAIYAAHDDMDFSAATVAARAALDSGAAVKVLRAMQL